MALPAKVHDPLYNFETHFPERLSRLHLNPEIGNHPIQRKSKKSRAARQGIRYKTQPVTFDEIQEVDEEGIKESEDKAKEKKTEGLKTQFAAFSKSMDGLVPKAKHKKVGDAIQENTDETDNTAKKQPASKQKIGNIGRVHSDAPEFRLSLQIEPTLLPATRAKENKENDEPSTAGRTYASTNNTVPASLPPTGQNVRRQRQTAKAKRRQMQGDGVDGGGDQGT